MPYKMSKRNGKYCVMNEDTGENKGCSDSRAMAVRHMRALYAAEGSSKELTDIDKLVDAALDDFIKENPDEENVVEKDFYGETAAIYPIGMAVSYEELDAIEMARERELEVNELISQFPVLASNIMYDSTIEDKASAIEGLASELSSRISDAVALQDENKEVDLDKAAKREDVSPADRKRAVSEYGNVKYADERNKKYPIDTEEHIRAAWNYIGQSRNQGKYSSSEVASIKRKIIAAWKKKIDPAGPPSAKSLDEESLIEKIVSRVKEVLGIGKSDDESWKPDGENPMMIWKDSDGRWKWIARYSNTFRDRDNPPEIISSDSHRRFVELVDKGLAPLPELWLWHVKDWKIGQASLVAYDKVSDTSGFAVAFGHFDPGCEQVAEWLSSRKDVKVSHGMPVTSIARDPGDPTIIVEHETREISPLPAWVAANEITGFVAYKEADMAIPEDKKKTLIDKWGMPKEMLDALETANKADSEKALDEGIQTKETPPVSDEQEVKEEVVAPTAPVEPPQEVLSREEVLEAMQAVVATVTALGEKVAALSKEITEMKEKAKVADEVSKTSPRASLLSMLSGGSIIGKETAAELKDGETFGNKPKETEIPAGLTGIPLIDGFLTASKK